MPLFTSCSQASRLEPTVSVPKKEQTQVKAEKQLIVIDPGHGGNDLGTHSHSVEEKTLALRTAILTKKYLNEKGYRVILTRGRDVFISLKKRVAIANDTHSQLFVSIHYNGHKNPEAKGVEVFFYEKGRDSRAKRSKQVAECVLSRLVARTRSVSRGVKHGNFHVIRETNMPAILVEGGFVTHPHERSLLKDNKYLDQVARAVAEGVNRFFETTQQTNITRSCNNEEKRPRRDSNARPVA